MARQKLFDNTILAGNASVCIDLSGNANSMSFDAPYETTDTTSFADLVRKREALLHDSSFEIGIQADAAEQPRADLESLQSDPDGLWSWIESNASMAEQDYGLFVQALQTNLQRVAQMDGILTLNVSGDGNGHLIVGQVMQEDETLSATGQSTGFQFGALSAGETLRAAMFVLTATAGTLDMTIESDDNSGFTSATTRMTFSQFSAVGTEQQTVAGAITDDWWRVNYTIATGPFVAVVLMGKQ